MSGATPTDAGLASGLFNTTQQIGAALGVAVLSTLAAAQARSLHATGTGSTAALAAGYHLAFAIGTGLAVAAIIVTVAVFWRRTGSAPGRPRRRHPPRYPMPGPPLTTDSAARADHPPPSRQAPRNRAVPYGRTSNDPWDSSSLPHGLAPGLSLFVRAEPRICRQRPRGRPPLPVPGRPAGRRSPWRPRSGCAGGALAQDVPVAPSSGCAGGALAQDVPVAPSPRCPWRPRSGCPWRPRSGCPGRAGGRSGDRTTITRPPGSCTRPAV